MGCCGDDKKKPVQEEKKSVDTPEYKIIVIGDSSVGKTAIIHQYISNTFNKNEGKATIGVANQTKVVEVPDGGKNGIPSKMKLDVWDTAGQEEFAAMTRNYYAGSHAVAIVYAIDKITTFKSVDNYYNFVKSQCSDDVIIALVGNKCDLQNERRVSYDDLCDKAGDLDTLYFETSAMPDRRETITDLFSEFIRQLSVKAPKAGS